MRGGNQHEFWHTVPILFPIPHRPTKLLLVPAACKSLEKIEVAPRALATSLRFSLGEQAKKIPTDKSWDFEYWWRRRDSNPRPQVLHSQDYMLSLVIWVSPRARQLAGSHLASRFDGSTRQSGHTAQRG